MPKPALIIDMLAHDPDAADEDAEDGARDDEGPSERREDPEALIQSIRSQLDRLEGLTRGL